MSIESAKAYLERIKADEEFRNKVDACKDTKERVAFIKAKGFDFSKADLNVVMSVMDDSELQKVAGGTCVLRVATLAAVEPRF